MAWAPLACESRYYQSEGFTISPALKFWNCLSAWWITTLCFDIYKGFTFESNWSLLHGWGTCNSIIIGSPSQMWTGVGEKEPHLVKTRNSVRNQASRTWIATASATRCWVFPLKKIFINCHIFCKCTFRAKSITKFYAANIPFYVVEAFICDGHFFFFCELQEARRGLKIKLN